jgi:hypothetical protein
MIHMTGKYFSVEEFRQKCGYKTNRPIYRLIKKGAIDGLKKIGRTYWIPSGTLISAQNVKTGKYVGVSALISENKKRLEGR